MDIHEQTWLKDNAAAVLDAVVDAILTIDTQGFIQSVNASTIDMFGYTEQELIGHSVNKLMPAPHRVAHHRYVNNYLETHDPKIIGIGRELTARRADGVIFPIYLAVSEIKSDEGTYFVGIIRDLTVQKAAENALAEQKEQVAQVGRLSTMGEMTASIAHEVNQPLTAISMYSQACLRLLQREPVDVDKVADALQKLNEQSLRAGAVIERIQRFVQHASGTRELVDLGQLVLDLKHLAVGDARLHGMDLQFSVPAEPIEVFCDPVQIQQVALNLIRNAIDAMQEQDCRYGNGVNVELTLDADQQRARVTVVDTGVGIAPEQKDKIFSAFHSTKASGMGMGLSICRSIMEDHEGDLSFYDNTPHGTCFYFELPAGELSE